MATFNINAGDIDTLNDCLQLLNDSCRGYREMADAKNVSRSQRENLLRMASERCALVEEIEDLVREYDAEPLVLGTLGGKVYLAAAKFVGMVGNDDQVAYAAVRRGDAHLAEQIETFLKRVGLQKRTATVLERALKSAKASV